MKVAKDKYNIYFYVKTVKDITPPTDGSWMILFISTGETPSWYSYNYVVNRVSPVDSEAVIEKVTDIWNFEKIERAKLKVEGNQMMLAIPRNLIGFPVDKYSGLINLQFKWADNYQPGDIRSFYTMDDAAPLGRLNFIFSNIA